LSSGQIGTHLPVRRKEDRLRFTPAIIFSNTVHDLAFFLLHLFPSQPQPAGGIECHLLPPIVCLIGAHKFQLAFPSI
jgi:hypothetical protein